MQKLVPHLWFDKEALEAVEWYTKIFKDSKIHSKSTLHNTPSGDCDVLVFSLMGQDFMAISAGPYFKPTPAISFMVACDTVEEVDRLWNELIVGGKALMEKNEYPFSKQYGWLEDKYGFTWQIMHDGGMNVQRITPSLMFTGEKLGKAKEAMEFYISTFKNSEKMEGHIDVTEEGFLNYARFKIEGREVVVMDGPGPHTFDFTEAISLLINCDSQEEIDTLTESLSVIPEAEQCGWLKDKFGVSWQMNPGVLNEMMESDDKEAVARVTKAFLSMKRFDIQKLKDAFEGRV